ncbi:MAG: response regulator transcription factor [Actinobacteria bacterium]|nr:MAG: response regulator transcription factor [Actinomycetota bacterium]
MVDDPPAQSRVLLAGDESPLRAWVRLSLAGTELRVAGETEGAEDTARLAAELEPHVVLVEATGTELVSELREAGISVPVVLLSPTPKRGFNENAREAGAQGTVLATGSIGRLVAALRAVLRGEPSFDAAHPGRPAGQSALSPRERDVLRLVGRGATNREIANELEIGDQTVKTLLARSCAKLGVSRRADAVAAARGLGLLVL